MKIHMVKKGETLYELSEKYHVDLDKLIEINPQIEDPDELDVGMKVKIPSTTSQVAYSNIPKSIDKLEQTKIKPTEPIQKAEPIQKGEPIAKESKPPGVTMKAKEYKLETTKHVKEFKPETVKQSKVSNTPEAAVQGKGKTPSSPTETGKWADPVQPQASEDLFKQYKVPAEKVGSFYDIPEIPDNIPGLTPQQPFETQQAPDHGQYNNMQADPYASGPYASQPDCGCMPMHDQMMPFNNMMAPEGYAQPSYNLPYDSKPNPPVPYGMPNAPYGMHNASYGMPYAPYGMSNPSAPYGMAAEMPCDVPVYPGINNQHPMHLNHMNPHGYGMPDHILPNPTMPHGQMVPRDWKFTESTSSANRGQTEDNLSETRGENESLNKDSKKGSAKASISSKKASKAKPERKMKKPLKKIVRESENIPWINR